MDGYSNYQLTVRESFAVAYRFFDKHKDIATEAQWHAVVAEFSQYTDPFTLGLLMAVVDELGRQFKKMQ